jgi:segregation and condensation protein B
MPMTDVNDFDSIDTVVQSPDLTISGNLEPLENEPLIMQGGLSEAHGEIFVNTLEDVIADVSLPFTQIDDAVDFEYYRQISLNLNGQSVFLLSALEVLLFVSDGPVETSHLTKVLDQNAETIYGALQTLNQNYIEQNSGLRIQNYNGRFQLVTHAVLASLIETYLSLDLTTKLSAPALETLAIIAYRQPVTRAQIESVRGVDSSGMLRTLIQRGLIAEAGRLEGVGRPILYTVTEEFMHHFGLTGLDELPLLETTEADTLWAATKLAELEDHA